MARLQLATTLTDIAQRRRKARIEAEAEAQRQRKAERQANLPRIKAQRDRIEAAVLAAALEDRNEWKEELNCGPRFIGDMGKPDAITDRIEAVKMLRCDEPRLQITEHCYYEDGNDPDNAATPHWHYYLRISTEAA